MTTRPVVLVLARRPWSRPRCRHGDRLAGTSSVDHAETENQSSASGMEIGPLQRGRQAVSVCVECGHADLVSETRGRDELGRTLDILCGRSLLQPRSQQVESAQTIGPPQPTCC